MPKAELIIFYNGMFFQEKNCSIIYCFLKIFGEVWKNRYGPIISDVFLAMEPDLCSGITLAIFKSSGKIPEQNEQLISAAMIWAIRGIDNPQKLD